MYDLAFYCKYATLIVNLTLSQWYSINADHVCGCMHNRSMLCCQLSQQLANCHLLTMLTHFDPEDGGSMLLQNTDNTAHFYMMTALQTRNYICIQTQCLETSYYPTVQNQLQ